jgi:hypothetical protein
MPDPAERADGASLAEVAVRVYQVGRYHDDDVTRTDPGGKMDAQLASDLLLGYVGLVVVIGIVGVIASFWYLGRQGYRKD